jgi:hypothetical protein
LYCEWSKACELSGVGCIVLCEVKRVNLVGLVVFNCEWSKVRELVCVICILLSVG